MNAIDVLVIGRACVDYIAVVERFPQEDEKIALDCRLIEAGGQGSTASCCISRLGGQVAYIGKVADDEEGRFCLNRLKAFGVSTEYIEVLGGERTPVAYIFVTRASGKRTILYEPFRLPMIAMDGPMIDLMSQAKVVLLDPQVTYLSRELSRHQDMGFQIVYDCERWREGIEEMMTLADFFIPSSDFFKSAHHSNAEDSLANKMHALDEMTKGRLIVTDGEKGAYYINQGHIHHVPAPQVKVKDTTGAGDNFHAAFAYAISQGLDIHEAVKLSVAVASCSCRELGGREGIPGLEEAQALAKGLVVKMLK